MPRSGLRWLLVAWFLWLAGGYWHPYYGFTKLLQLNASAQAEMLPSLRDAPIYVYRDTGGYDGLYYAQLSTSPSLRDPALRTAIDNLAYRGRRMLLSWAAWVAGGGEPVAAVRAYAWLNIVIWLGVAALLWRLFPPDGWRGTIAWAGMLFSAGALSTVRFSLTDLAALGLIAAAGMLVERQRANSAAGLLAAGALARETALLSAVALLPTTPGGWRPWLRVGGRGLLVAVPLAAWLAYLWRYVGPSEPGIANFARPVAGLVEKWCSALVMLSVEPLFSLALTSLLSLVALTVQLIYLLVRPRWRDPWWRTGVVYIGLMLCLGTAVWEGYPGAATRVLLPLSLAFNVLAVRSRAGVLWLVLGNLSVFSGVQGMLLAPNPDRHELAAPWSWNQSLRLETDARWTLAESNWSQRWAWCPQDGTLKLQAWPHPSPVRVQLSIRGISARPLEIRHAGKIVWQGQIGDQPQWIELPPLPLPPSGLVLELHSDQPPEMETTGRRPRAVGFACFGVRLAE